MARRTSKESKQLATIISLVLNPVVMIAMQSFILIRQFEVTPAQLLYVTLPFAIPVAAYIIVMVFILKRVDYEFTKKESRWPVLIMAVAGLLVSVPLSVQVAPSLTKYLLHLLILMLLVACLTYYWKVSLHTLFFSMTVIMLAAYINQSLILMFILLPVLYWCRITLHKHTPSQLFLGTLLPIILVL